MTHFHDNACKTQLLTAGGWTRAASSAFALSYYYYGMKS
ncbi:MAG: hypothetical protein DELT_02245 [Desulfovibrio sp.]